MTYLLFIVAYVVQISAHGYISQPAASYKDPSTMTSYITTVDATKLFTGRKWNDTPDNNSKQYQNLVQSGGINTLNVFFSDYIDGCPNNNLDSVIDVSGLTTLNWQNDQEKEGFITSHSGPCEVWFDNNQVFTNINCVKSYTTYPAKITIDYSKCKVDKCLLSFYWLALHEPRWQLYKSCVWIKGAPNANTTPTNIEGYLNDKNMARRINCSFA